MTGGNKALKQSTGERKEERRQQAKTATNKQDARCTLSVYIELRLKQELTHFHRPHTETGSGVNQPTVQSCDKLQCLFHSFLSTEGCVCARRGRLAPWLGFKEEALERLVSLLAVTGHMIARSLGRYLPSIIFSFISPASFSSTPPLRVVRGHLLPL